MLALSLQVNNGKSVDISCKLLSAHKYSHSPAALSIRQEIMTRNIKVKSTHSILVALFGWLILGTYIFYDYTYYGNRTLTHFFSFSDSAETLLHVIILSAFIGAHITAYLINERKKLLNKTNLSKLQIKQSALEWIATFDAIPYSVLLTDKDCKIIRANKHLVNQTGLSLEELTSNRKCHDTFCKNNRPNKKCPLHNKNNTSETSNYDYFDPDLNKSFSESITPVIDEKGSINSYVHVLIDVTDSKEKERKLTESKDAFFNMLTDLDSSYRDLELVHNDLIIALSNIIDAKSSWTRGHSIETTNFATKIAKEMSLDHHEIETLKTAALLHDIGKIGTYDNILDKPDKLDEKERMLIQLHPLRGEEMLSPIKGLGDLLPIIRYHHEKYDGTGYPDGLKGDDIPLLARVLCVADSYDAMISDRPYRAARGTDYAVSELHRCANSHFDPAIVDAFSNVLARSSNADSEIYHKTT